MAVKRVGVAGSGIMAAGIAECAARAGFDVVVRARRAEAGAALTTRLAQGLGRRVEQGKLAAPERDAIVSRIVATSRLEDLADCDLVIEAVVEDLAAKRRLFAALDQTCRESTILATNTSTLPVIELAMATRRPHRVCGLHFFNPAPVMSTVEIVRPLTADQETIDDCRAFAEACGKEPIDVRDRAGFVVNALLFPYLNNAARLVDGGVAGAEDVDAAMRGACGFPMGPLALLDLVGLDTSVSILEVLHRELGDPNYAPAPLLRRMVSAGWLGRKTGRGFYRYETA